MRGMLSALMLVGLLLGGCGFSGGESAPRGAVNLPSEVHSGNANLFKACPICGPVRRKRWP